jgi:hypothetical protein
MMKTKCVKTAVFISIEDPDALDGLRAQHGNRDLVVSVAFYESAGASSLCVYALCFRIRSSSLEQARQSALEVVYYLAENCGMPPESLDLIFNGGGLVAQDDGRANAGTATSVEIVVLVPPAVFGGRPTPLMLALNYDLARLMHGDGIGVEVDCYAQNQQFIPLSNAIRGATGHYVIPLRPSELLYLDARAIFEMSNQPRPDDSYAEVRRVPETAEWFAAILAEAERRERCQTQLGSLLQRDGWQIPPCIRRLHWANLGGDQVIDACRIIARWYPFSNASKDETGYQVLRLARRHDISDHARLRAIIAFGNENPTFVGCEHPLLRQFCPAGACFVKKLIDDMKSPRLFT